MVYLVKNKWHPNLAAIFLMLLSFVCILLPVGGILLMLGNKISDAVTNSEQVVEAFKSQMAIIENNIGFDITSSIDVSEISTGQVHFMGICYFSSLIFII
jgi:predicted PurR-regulated permease PerM